MKASSHSSKTTASSAGVSQRQGFATKALTNNRPQATALLQLQRAATSFKAKQLKASPATSQQVAQLMSEQDIHNKSIFTNIWMFRNGGLVEALEFLVETYNLGSLSACTISVATGVEEFHGRTMHGYRGNGTYTTPEITISEGYIERMYEDSFERIILTLKHEFKHVNDRNDAAFIAQNPSSHEMEFRAYMEELFPNTQYIPNSDTSPIPVHSAANQMNRITTALTHYNGLDRATKNKYTQAKDALFEAAFSHYYALSANANSSNSQTVNQALYYANLLSRARSTHHAEAIKWLNTNKRS